MCGGDSHGYSSLSVLVLLWALLPCLGLLAAPLPAHPLLSVPPSATFLSGGAAGQVTPACVTPTWTAHPNVQHKPHGQARSPTGKSPWGHNPFSPRCYFLVASIQLLHSNIYTLNIDASPNHLCKNATSPYHKQTFSGNTTFVPYPCPNEEDGKATN